MERIIAEAINAAPYDDLLAAAQQLMTVVTGEEDVDWNDDASIADVLDGWADAMLASETDVVVTASGEDCR
ncbi:MAG: hypothetical protein GY798_04860 [Hyphomicrobiales bacterium]|nr:hypothetical protein [Hyphomicrobiales bacterium]